MQVRAESGKSALPICNYSQILYQFLTFTQNLKRSPLVTVKASAKENAVTEAIPLFFISFILFIFSASLLPVC